MRVEVTIDRTKKLPTGALAALEKELSLRLEKTFTDCRLVVRTAGSDGLTVHGGEKKEVEKILQETWESADDWFF